MCKGKKYLGSENTKRLVYNKELRVLKGERVYF